MSKRRYFPGKPVEALDELFEHSFFIIKHVTHMKTYHAGWLLSQPDRCLKDYINHGILFVAVEKESDNDRH